jgi:hypothetical protein
VRSTADTNCIEGWISAVARAKGTVCDPRINAFDGPLASARAEGVIKEDIHGFQVDALVTGLLLAQYRGLPEMNTANKDATLMADTIWKFIST